MKWKEGGERGTQGGGGGGLACLLSRDVVGTHNSDLLSGGDLAREDTTEGIETSLVTCGHHLRYVHHKRSVGVACADGGGSLKESQ